MLNRPVEIAGFLAQNGWDAALQVTIDADFSPRRYARLTHQDGRHAILMDADSDQKTLLFVALAKHLRELEVLAPEIYAADSQRGLVLMQDFGDRNFGRLLDEGADTKTLYRRAIEVLVHLHARFDEAPTHDLNLPIFNAKLLTEQAALFLDAYVPSVREREVTEEEREDFYQAWYTVLRSSEKMAQSLMLRDYMPDNLMDVSGRVGVLDFQDAGVGPIAYDVASLCEMVRRDGGGALFDEMIAYYHDCAQPELSLNELRHACYILAAQRHTRVLGVVMRLATKTGRRDKLAFAPRIRQHLDYLLGNDALRPVKRWMECL